MTQPDLFARAPKFDGPDLQPEDHARLGGQITRILVLMRDGQWRTLRQIAVWTKSPEASVSAQLRNLRKAKHGGYTIERRHVRNGLFEYRLMVK